MTARTHDLAAITALAIVVLSRPLPTMTLATALVAVLANQVGGIAPDIDQPTAPLWRNLPIGHLFGRLVGKGFGGHRFVTHSLIGLAIFGLLSRLLLSSVQSLVPSLNSGYIWWAFIIGMVSHLVMDSLTKEGVPWLLPLPFKFGLPPMKAWRITTGKAVEGLVVFPILLLADVWLCHHYYQTIISLIKWHLHS